MLVPTEICDTPFWNINQTLHTGRLDFTPCFEQIMLIWSPLITFLLFSPMEIYHIRNSPFKSIPWNLLNSSKVIVTALLITYSFVELVYYENEGNYKRLALVHYATPLLKFISFSFSLILIIWNRIKGLSRSGLLFWLWTSLSAFGVARLWREIMTLQNYGKGMDSKIFHSVTYLAYYFLILLNCCLTFFKESLPTGVEYSERVDEICPDALATYPSVLVASWIRPILRKANKGKIFETDLFELKHELNAEKVDGHFEKTFSHVKWEKYRQTRFPWKMTRSKLFFVLVKCFIRTFLFGLFLSTLYIITYYMCPQIFRLILIYADHNERRIWENVAYPVIGFSLSTTMIILHSQYLLRIGMISLKTKIILISEIFKKALRLSRSRNKQSIGEIVNLMNVDVERITETLQYVYLIWGMPIRIILALSSLYLEIGNAVVAQFIILVLFISIQIVMGFYTRYYTSKLMNFKDNRMKVLSESLSQIKTLKYYVWEPSFLKIINELRSHEVYYLRKLYYLHIISVFLSTCTPFLMTVASFAYYVLKEDEPLTAEVAFISSLLFDMLQVNLSKLPNVILGLIQLAVSYNRIGRFLNADELEAKPIFQNEEKDIGTAFIRNGYFAWRDLMVLKEITFHLPKGCLKAIFGPTGGGKSSLLAALAGEMFKLSGIVTTKGKIAVVTQVPWIQNECVRDVILFGKSFDNKLYNKIIRACGLHIDLESFAKGDLTRIGTKGITLSLGQKQKICLARAVYSGADLYFLDDPISALDEHMARRVFKNVISNKGLLAGKTRLVVTTNLNYLYEFDSVILMENGKIVADESYNHLLKTGKLLSLLRTFSDTKLLKDLNQFWAVRISDDMKRTSFCLRESVIYRVNDNADNMMIGNLSYFRPTLFDHRMSVGQNVFAVSDENRSIPAGKVMNSSVFWKYLKIMGRSHVFNCVASGVFVEVFYFLSTLWLAGWTQQHKNPNIKQHSIFYLTVYASFIIGLLFSSAIFCYSICMGAMKASIYFHDELLNSVFRFPMSFFDHTPLGRLLNRFGGDVYTLDSQLPLNMQYYISTTFRVLGVLVVTLQFYPIVLPVSLTVILSYLLLQNYFLDTSRQLALLEAKSRSPIFSHFEETLSGVSVIRAYNAEEKFIGVNRSYIERNLSIIYHTVIANRWLELRMETIGHLFVFIAILIVLFTPSFNASMIGLVILYLLQMTDNLNNLVQLATLINTNCVSVERINEYIEETKEPPWDSASEDVPPDWPRNGGIKFENFVVKYPNSYQKSLNGISFTVLPNEKISIVGRSGAGKTTLMHSLFRIIEGRSGAVYIDGVDISKVGLGRLRSSLNIIPQDPVLFAGTLRMNLDPRGNFTDEELWNVLSESYLGYLANELSDGLNHIVEGNSFSVGERQMLCIARALLKKSTILMIDEATSLVDWWSESLMKRTINKHFSHCTILSVDHRLKNVLDSDRVLVLSHGQVAEFDTPQKLLENSYGVFYSLAVEAGIRIPAPVQKKPRDLKITTEEAEQENIKSVEQRNSNLGVSHPSSQTTRLKIDNEEIIINLDADIEEDENEILQSVLEQDIPIIETRKRENSIEQPGSDERELSIDDSTRVMISSILEMIVHDIEQENEQ